MIIFHNPYCSKSCAAISALDESGINYEIRNYLENPPTEKEMETLLIQLGISAQQLLRKNEALFKEKFANSTKTEAEWIALMCEHPILIERPLLIHGNKAIIGRPAEKIIEFLK